MRDMKADFAIKVIFGNTDLEKKFQTTIQSFLDELVKNEENTEIQFETVESQQNVSFPLDQHFVFINEPIQNGTEPPSSDLCESTYEGFLCNTPVQESCPETRNRIPSLTCFNCLGNHHLNACLEQRDAGRIASNRKELFDSNQTPGRYFLENGGTRSDHTFKPGSLSEALRKALGLHSEQLPMHIYNMRILGYPPGWMKEAEVVTSGLSICDSNSITNGFQEENASSKPAQYSFEKFIEFTGFNVPTPNGFKDEWRELCMLPIQAHQQLSEVWKFNVVPTSYKRKSMNGGGLESNKKNNENAQDCEGLTPSKARKICNALNFTPEAQIQDSPFRKTNKALPDQSKFADGITDYMPYENLPDATGHFDKIEEILKGRQSLAT